MKHQIKFDLYKLLNTNKMKLVQKLIFKQNKELLERIANDKYKTQEDKEEFIKKYHKIGYAHLNIVKKDQTDNQQKKYNRVMR